MAYRPSNYSLQPSAQDPITQANAGMGAEEGMFAERAILDEDSRAAAAYEQTRDRSSGIPVEGDRSVVGAMWDMVPGDGPLQAGLKTAGARTGELIYGATGIPQAVAQGLGAGEWYEENAPNVRDWTNENVIKPVFGDREKLDKQYGAMTWDTVKQKYAEGDALGTAMATARMIIKEGVGSAPDMVAMMTGPLALAGYGATRVSEIAEDRSTSSGELNNAGDIGIALATAGASVTIDKLALGNLLNKAGFGKVAAAAQKRLTTRLASAATTEAATEAVQEHIEYVGGTVRDNFSDFKEFFDSPEDFENALVGAIIGGGVGATVVGVGEFANRKTEVTDGPAQDEQAAIAGPKETLALPAPPLVTPPPAPAAAEVPQQEPEDTGSPIEPPIPVLQDGQQDFIAPPEDPVELPEGVDPDSLVNDIRGQQTRRRDDSAVGERLRETGVGKLVQQAIRGKASAKELLEIDRKESEKPKDDREERAIITNEDKLRQQKQGVSKAKRATPGPVLYDLVNDLARISAIEAEKAARESTVGSRRNMDLGARTRVAETRSRESQLAQQTDTFQGLADLIRNSVKTELGSGASAEILGNLARNREIAKELGVDLEPLLKAKTPVEARVALDALAKKAAARYRNEDIQMPPRLSLDENLAGQLTPAGRFARAAIADSVRSASPGEKSSVESMTPEKLYTEEYTDEEGNRKSRVIAPSDSDEGRERRAEMRAQDAANRRRSTGAYNDPENDSRPYEDTEAGDPEYPAGREAAMVRGLNEVIRSGLASSKANLKEAIRQKNPVGQKQARADIATYTELVNEAEAQLDLLAERDKLRKVVEKGKTAALDKANLNARARRDMTYDALETQEADAKLDRLAVAGDKASDRIAEIEAELKKFADSAETVTPSYLAGQRESERDRTKSPTSKKSKADEAFAKRIRSGAQEVGREIINEEERLATAERAVGLKRVEKAKKIEKARAKIAAKKKEEASGYVDPLKGAVRARTQENRGEPSGEIDDTQYGVSKAALAEAAKVFSEYGKFYRSLTPAQQAKTTSPALIEQRILTGKRNTISNRGFGTTLVLNPAEPDWKKALFSVAGVVPMRKINRGKDGRITSVKRTVPYSPGDKSPYSKLKRRTFYLPEDVVMYRGNRVYQFQEGEGMSGPKVQRAQLPESDRTISPKEQDSILEFLGKQEFDWVGKPNELAMLQYLANKTVAGRVRARTPEERAIERRKAQRKEEQQPSGPPEIEPYVIEDDPFDIEDDPFDDGPPEIDEWALANAIANGKASPEQKESYRQQLVREIGEIEPRLAAARTRIEGYETYVRAQTPEGNVLNVPPSSQWPYEGENTAILQEDGAVTTFFGTELMRADGLSANEALVQGIMQQAATQIQVDAMTLADLQEKLENLDANRSPSTPGTGKKEPGKTAKGGPDDLQPPPIPEADDSDGRGQRVVDRVPGSEAIDPKSRRATDLYEGSKPTEPSAGALQRAGAVAVRGPAGGVALNKWQKIGAARLFDAWSKKAGGFLNMDGTGFGKTRQIAASAQMISEAEEEAGTRRPILLLVQGSMAGRPSIKYTDETKTRTRKSHPNLLVDHLYGDMDVLGIDPDATYSDGSPRFEINGYSMLDKYAGTTEYAAVIADEAQAAKGGASWATGMDALNTPFRAFFTATPTDRAGQEIYWLKHMMRKAGESIQEVTKRVARELSLTQTQDKKGNPIYRLPDNAIMSEQYAARLDRLMQPLVKRGQMVARTFGRKSKNYVETVPPEFVDQEAVDLYEKLLASGTSPTEQHMRRLVEHMKVPYMVDRTKQRISKNQNKIIAVFSYTGAVTDKNNPLHGTRFAQPALEVYEKAIDDAGIPYGKLAGEGTDRDQRMIDDFQGSKSYAGDSQVMIISDRRGSTGLNLNDKHGSYPRHMLVAMTSQEGQQFMQLLGRHDRNDNMTVPYTSFIRVDNPTDREYRRAMADKIKLQEHITGVKYYREMNPGLADAQIYEDKDFLARKRQAAYIADSTDQLISDAIAKGNANAIDLLHTIAVGTENRELAALATDLLRVTNEGNKPKVATLEGTSTAGWLGAYFPETETVGISEEAGAAQTFIHELVHHHTVRAIRNNPIAAANLNTLRQALETARPDLRARFGNAFSDNNEFVAEMFSDPEFQQEMRDTKKTGKGLSLFDRFVRWVRQTLGINHDSQTVLEKVLDLNLFSNDIAMDPTVTPLDKMPPPTLPRQRPLVAGTLERMAQKGQLGDRAQGAWETTRPKMLWAMTFGQIVDTYKNLAARTALSRKPGGNILEEMEAMQEAITSKANSNNQEYQKAVIEPLRKWAETKGSQTMSVRMREGGPAEDMTQLQYLANLMNVSGYAQVHFGMPAGDRKNRMLSTKPEAKAAWKVHRTQSQRAEFKEAMALYNKIAAYFDSQRTAKLRVARGAWLDNMVPLPKGSWTESTDKEQADQLKKLGASTPEELKELGVSKDALDGVRQIMNPGIVPGAYFPLRRYGEYVVTVRGDYPYISDDERDRLLREYPNAKDKDGAIEFRTVARFETLAEAQRYKVRLEEDMKGMAQNVKVEDAQMRTVSNEDMFGSTPFNSLVKNFNDRLNKNPDLDAAERDTMQKLFGQAMLDLMPETSVANAMRERAGTHGASLDIMRILPNYGASQGYLLANLQYSKRNSDLQSELREHTRSLPAKEQRALEQVRQELGSRSVKNATTTYDMGQFGQTLSDVGFLYYLVGFSYNVVNMTQVPLVTGPYLAGKYGAKASSAALMNAYKTISGTPMSKLFKSGMTLTQLRGLFKGKDYDRSNYDVMDEVMSTLTDPNHKKMIGTLVEEGHVEASLAMDMNRMSERQHMSASGKPLKTTPWQYLTDWMRTAPHLVEVMNRSVTAVAAFDLEYQRTKNYDKSLKAAREAVKKTQFVYQNWNKPPVFQSQTGRLVLMFKQHVQNMYFIMIRNAAQSIKGTPEEKATARKTLAYLVGAHMMAGGVVGGTPEMAKWLLNLLFWAASDDDEPIEFDKWVRNTMYDAFGGEQGFGDAGATLASHGLPGFVGASLSSRVGIDSMLLYGAPDFSSRDSLARFVWDTAGGPLAGLASRTLVDAPQAYKSGNYSRMAQALVPKSIRDPIRAYDYSQKGMVDASGKVFLDSDQMNWWDFGQKMLGFQPSVEADTYQSRSVGQARLRVTRDRNNLFTRFYTADTKARRMDVIRDIREWNQANPAFAIDGSDLKKSFSQRRRYEMLTEKGVYTPNDQKAWARDAQRSY